MIVIVDYQVGNLGSIQNMFKKVGAPALVSQDPEEIRKADKLVLPGMGRFDFCMGALERSGLRDVLEERVLQDRVPCLGICVGFQILASHGEEGDCAGLNWIPAQVKKLRLSEGLKIPHMGWNFVEVQKESPLVQGFDQDTRFYFAHSYFMECQDPHLALLTTEYGHTFVCAIQKDNIWGVQFHPEKSHKFGMRLFKNFSEMPVSI